MAVAADFVTPVTQRYVALFNRVPDTAGLAFWTNALVNGVSLETVTEGFLTAAEGQQTYSPFAGSEDFVIDFYTTVFGRAPDDDGLEFWTAALDGWGGAASTAARARLAAAIIDILSQPLGVQPEGLDADAYAQTVVDRATFANKVELGIYFGYLQYTDLDAAQGSDLSLAGVTDAKSSIEGIKAGAFAAAIGGTADVRGTAGDDIFTATLADLNATATRRFDGNQGQDTLNLTAVADGSIRAGSIRNIETVSLSGITDGFALDASGALAGVSTLYLRGVTGTATVSNLGDIELGLQGFGGGSGTVVADFGDAIVDATVALDGAGGHSLRVVGDALTTLTLTGTGGVAIDAANTVTTLELVSDAAGVSSLSADVSAAAHVTLVDASASTGGVTVTLGAATRYLGGAGEDIVSLEAASSAVLDGGAGDQDVILVAQATDVLAAATITNFEILRLTSGAGGAYTAGGFTSLEVVTYLGAGVVFRQVDAGATLSLSSAANAVVSYELATDTQADVLRVDLQASLLGDTYGVVTADGIETIELVSTRTSEHTGGLIGLNAGAAKTVTVSGDGAVVVNLPDVALDEGLSALTRFDASAATGTVVFMSTNTTLGATVEITGSATASNVLIGNRTNDHITGGADADFLLGSFAVPGGGDLAPGGLDVLTGGGGTDVFALGPNANAQVYATVTDFGTDDYLMFSPLLAGSLLVADGLVHVTLASTATLADYVDAAASAAVAGAGAITWFQFGGDTWLLVDNHGGVAGFQAGLDGGDQLVKLNGLLDLGAANHASGALSFSDLDDMPVIGGL